MPTVSLTMHQLHELFRLHFALGCTQREIARALGLSTGVVNKYLQAARAAGVGWEVIAGLSEAHLRASLFPPSSGPPEWSKRQPDFALVHQELKRKGVTRQLLWDEYRSVEPETAYGYVRFCQLYLQWNRSLRRSLRQTHLAGEKFEGLPIV